MSDLRVLDSGPRAPASLAADLRAIADAVDRKEVVALVAAYMGKDYTFLYGASVRDGLELATLLQNKCLQRYTSG